MGKLSDIRWRRVSIAGIGIPVMAIISVTLIVTAYAAYLGFQARGAPDQNLINQFADTNAPWISGIISVGLALLGGWWTGRGVDSGKQLNGLVVGIIAVVLSLLISRFNLNAFDIVEYLLTLVAGWFGGRMTE